MIVTIASNTLNIIATAKAAADDRIELKSTNGAVLFTGKLTA